MIQQTKNSPLSSFQGCLHITLGLFAPPFAVAMIPDAIGPPLITNLVLTLIYPPLGSLHALYLIIRSHFSTKYTIVPSGNETAAGDDETEQQPQPIPNVVTSVNGAETEQQPQPIPLIHNIQPATQALPIIALGTGATDNHPSSSPKTITPDLIIPPLVAPNEPGPPTCPPLLQISAKCSIVDTED